MSDSRNNNNKVNGAKNEVIELLDDSDDSDDNDNDIDAKPKTTTTTQTNDDDDDDEVEVVEIDIDDNNHNNNNANRPRNRNNLDSPDYDHDSSTSTSYNPLNHQKKKTSAAKTKAKTKRSNTTTTTITTSISSIAAAKEPSAASSSRGGTTATTTTKNGVSTAATAAAASARTVGRRRGGGGGGRAVANTNRKKKLLQNNGCLVLQEDDNDVIMDDETKEIIEEFDKANNNNKLLLFEDKSFGPVPSSIKGQNNTTKGQQKCRCPGGKIAKLSYCQKSTKGNVGRPYYTCGGSTTTTQRKCNYFSWAFMAEQIQWYRFGIHTNHQLVNPQFGFRAQDLCQGRVGDCWFLSALAVVAERSDLIQRLFPTTTTLLFDKSGLIKVNLFIDGFWTAIAIDNFLPCMIDNNNKSDEQQLQHAIQESMNMNMMVGSNNTQQQQRDDGSFSSSSSSTTDPYVIADSCKETLRQTHEYLEQHQLKTLGKVLPNLQKSNWEPLKRRQVTTSDLAYSKALNEQLWVPILEKAYSKSHGCYKAISGGHIAEAFLDLTGAPTKVYRLMQNSNFQPRQFWYQLLHYKSQQLPMGCGTDNSAAGIIGMHAYSILDVREITNIPYQFFIETGVAHGNVSGFAEEGGRTVLRLLKIRNPHGRGEWQGDFSDRSKIWQKLQNYLDPTNITHQILLHDRSMKNDGTFWIDYDNFLMGFSNVDVVLAFIGNHAKSFTTNFPMKKSNHRCLRAFKISLLSQDVIESSSTSSTNKNVVKNNNDKVEVYIMSIQKSRRGATSGRSDRKKSYKVCDMGILVGSREDDDIDDDEDDYVSDDENLGRDDGTTSSPSCTVKDVRGQMFGFRRDGHYRLVLDRKTTPNAIVMPISFGHPAATDKELSFVVRFVSDAPLLIRELSEPPRMDLTIQRYCTESTSPSPSSSSFMGSGQGIRKVLLEEDNLFRIIQVDCLANGGGVVFLYICVNEDEVLVRRRSTAASSASSNNISVGLPSFEVEATCRGMSCRSEDGLLEHETIAKGKKFEAAWRRFKTEFHDEEQSRLLLVLYQSGQDTEFGSITCKKISSYRLGGSPRKNGGGQKRQQQQTTLSAFLDTTTTNNNGGTRQSIDPGVCGGDTYPDRGIFNSIPGSHAYHESRRARRSSHPGNSDMFDAMADGDIIIHDPELQQALEISQQQQQMNGRHHALEDLELQQVLELSKQQSHGNNDLQRALELSKMETSSSSSVAAKLPSAHEDSPSHANDSDLEAAIRLSLADQKQPPGVKQTSKPARKADNPLAKSTVLDLTGGDDEGGHDSSLASPSTIKKRTRPPIEDVAAICKTSGNEGKAEDEASPNKKPKDMTEKRKLAAEAAMKRQLLDQG